MDVKSSASKPSDVKLVIDRDEKHTEKYRSAKASVRYTGETNGEVTSSSSKQAQLTENGRNGHHQNRVPKSSPGDSGIVNPAPADSTWTVKGDGAVQLLMGSSEIESRVPVTVVQTLQTAVRMAPQRVALGVKRNGVWVKWTYQEYYDSVRSAAKSFIKVCTYLESNLSLCSEFNSYLVLCSEW